MANAKDYKCVRCGKQADTFVTLDVDVWTKPYCNECYKQFKIDIWIALGKYHEEQDRQSGGAAD